MIPLSLLGHSLAARGGNYSGVPLLTRNNPLSARTRQLLARHVRQYRGNPTPLRPVLKKMGVTPDWHRFAMPPSASWPGHRRFYLGSSVLRPISYRSALRGG
jgi:hypothetical protein